eukprot:m.154731 g.154731  ORF g.154731 m.154731 type:complete len:57 (+) comp38642_c0_seq1:702-872(+)
MPIERASSSGAAVVAGCIAEMVTWCLELCRPLGPKPFTRVPDLSNLITFTHSISSP